MRYDNAGEGSGRASITAAGMTDAELTADDSCHRPNANPIIDSRYHPPPPAVKPTIAPPTNATTSRRKAVVPCGGPKAVVAYGGRGRDGSDGY